MEDTTRCKCEIWMMTWIILSVPKKMCLEEPEEKKEEKKEIPGDPYICPEFKITRIHSVMVVRGARTQPIMN